LWDDVASLAEEQGKLLEEAETEEKTEILINQQIDEG
jgi:hypothetical protein